MRSLLLVSLALTVTLGLRAGENKETTLKGQVMCASCELKAHQGKCQTVIQVKDGDEQVTYYFKDRGAKESYHERICGGGRRDATVTGVIAEVDGKKWITPSRVEYLKK
jgi:Family of unknown function (DUF6370)